MSNAKRGVDVQRCVGRESWATLVLFMVLAALVVVLWWKESQFRQQRLEVETQVTAQQVRIRLENWFDNHMSIVEHLVPQRYFLGQ